MKVQWSLSYLFYSQFINFGLIFNSHKFLFLVYAAKSGILLSSFRKQIKPNNVCILIAHCQPATMKTNLKTDWIWFMKTFVSPSIGHRFRCKSLIFYIFARVKCFVFVYNRFVAITFALCYMPRAHILHRANNFKSANMLTSTIEYPLV